jgi:purine-binding chemotaxis protein CheW
MLMKSSTETRVPFLTFSLGNQLYALAIADVVEVAAMVELTHTPDAPPEYLGVVNRHGAILPLLDLRLIFKQPAPPLTPSSLFIVVTDGRRMLGLVVDEVRQVEYMDAAGLTPASSKTIHGIISYKEQLIQVIALPTLFAAYVDSAAAG